ncbi:hypothetical protein PYW07_017491 [Mythimna separata]|uniref:Uncharacterized protein n=1 Tax=Mythimna separata TaxID=271217 RepID=A0AAD7YYN3_MYTSE|nr:hypothetical protein PYW07_017478 [Mythimna separata]KAJ8730441.1 hypothetical protein PYW07_017479 [Mythimna separata]KAJ8730442.1 hypothetical protein PYW07_017480 [Mythimna separata]KAJ8730443.1 hypothetical protein PYW07_017481 [Mythimna separata]KAJ8730444.1 hypothetical protein PYW07_017482 [Mythimna separata]
MLKLLQASAPDLRASMVYIWAKIIAVDPVHIFPYMLKLLQASAPDLRASMVYIWAKIIAVDPVRNTPHH